MYSSAQVFIEDITASAKFNKIQNSCISLAREAGTEGYVFEWYNGMGGARSHVLYKSQPHGALGVKLGKRTSLDLHSRLQIAHLVIGMYAAYSKNNSVWVLGKYVCLLIWTKPQSDNKWLHTFNMVTLDYLIMIKM